MSIASTEPPRSTAASMDLLAHGVPLSLLLDLVLGPRSADLLAEERRQHLSPRGARRRSGSR